MSSDTALRVNNVGKRYEIYDAPHHRLFQTLLRGRKQFYKEFWALRDISFEVRRGECVGILGRNGSGKSTLLQVIAGTLMPTDGSVEVNGRVSALLELGSGFSPEFTGRENVYMNGSILGFSKAQIDEKFDEIAAFADIGEFIEQPVKIYSSGMYVRLAFAIAINVDPDILIVDEALAVGDARFSSRCMNKIRQFQESGVSILFVSHDTETVKRLCDHSLVLDRGQVVNRGLSADMVNWYIAFLTNDFDLEKTMQMQQEAVRQAEASSAVMTENESQKTQSQTVPSPPQERVDCRIDRAQHPEFTYFRHGDGNARIISAGLYDNKGRSIQYAMFGQHVQIRVEVEFYAELPYHIIGMQIRDSRGTDIIAINTFQERLKIPPVKLGERLSYTFEIPIELRPGNYSISCMVAYDQAKMEWMDWVDNILLFCVVDPEKSRSIFGLYHPGELNVSVKRSVSKHKNGASINDTA